MESSAVYAAKIREFQAIKAQVSSLKGPLNECESATNNSNSYTEKIIINGKVFDQEELKKFTSTLKTVASNLNAIMSECDEKIAKYQRLYEQALAREREEAERMRKKKV